MKGQVKQIGGIGHEIGGLPTYLTTSSWREGERINASSVLDLSAQHINAQIST
jgi:hypothetical protein